MALRDDVKTQFEIIERAARKYTEILEITIYKDEKAHLTKKKEEIDSIFYAIGFVRAHICRDEIDETEATK